MAKSANSIIILSVIILLSFSTKTYAAGMRCSTYQANETLPDYSATMNPTTINYTGPANQRVNAAVAGGSANALEYFYCPIGAPAVWYTTDSGITFLPVSTGEYFILTNIPGIGISFNIQPQGGTLTPINSKVRTYLGKATATGGDSYPSIYFNITLRYTGITIRSGTYTFPKTKLGRIELDTGYDAYGTHYMSWFDVWLNSFTITATTSTCTVNTKNLSVAFPAITASSINNAINGSNISTQNFSIQLNCPSTGGPNVYTTFTDNNNLGNTTNILTLNPSSSARGVGVQLKYKNTPIYLGPDSGMAGNSNQFLLQTSATGIVNIPFTATLIKTSDAIIGDYNATATFTMSYQ